MAAPRGRAARPFHGASDHLVSEAIYLADPEGNGIEVYCDRPSETWTWRDGMVEMSTRRSTSTASWRRPGLATGRPAGRLPARPCPSSGRDAGPAEAFYAGLLGFDVMPVIPAQPFSIGGLSPPHRDQHLEQPWRPGARGAATGWPMSSSSPTRAVRVRALPPVAGAGRRGQPARLPLRDPWGTSITLVTR